MGRSAGGGNYEIFAQAKAGPQTANMVNTYAAHIPVRAGDLIGILSGTGPAPCATVTSSTTDSYVYNPSDVAPGTTAPFSSNTNERFPISVKVSVDCVVPKLKGKTLRVAKRALKKASCTLGAVRPKGQTTGRVKRQKPAAGKVLAPGAKVNVRLG